MQFARNFSLRQHFSVLFLGRKNNVSSYNHAIRDIEGKDLKGSISDRLQKTYLSPLGKYEKQVEQKRAGILYGHFRRGMMAIPTRYADKPPVWIHYLVDTGSPATYLSSQAMQALTGFAPDERMSCMVVRINGRMIDVLRSGGDFQEINVLGMNYLVCGKSLVYHCLEKEMPNYYFEIEF